MPVLQTKQLRRRRPPSGRSAFHGSAGSTMGMRSSCAPEASISSRTMASILRITRRPSGMVV